MKEINLDIPPADHIKSEDHININNEKDSIIGNYLPNLSNYQKVLNIVQIDNNKYVFPLFPNFNFREQKEYYIFYNNNLKILIDLYKYKLKKIQLDHNVVLYFKKENLNNCLKKVSYDSSDYEIGPIKFFSYFIGSRFYQDVIDQANLLEHNLNILNKAEKEFSDKISPEKVCLVIVPENLFDEEIEVKGIHKNSEEKFYLEFLTKIEEIKKKKIDEKEKLKLMDEKINEYKKEIIPENSIDNKIAFSFVLNIISDFLSNYERSLERKSLEFLKIMDSIRRKLNYFLLEFRFKFIENDCPLLNIKINRYKILCNSIEKKAIYLEKGEIKKFMEGLEERIDNSAKNVNPNYQFKDIDSKILIKIAKKINFISEEKLSDVLDEKIKKHQSEYNSKKIELISSTVKDVIKISLFGLNGLNLMINGKEKKISKEQIEKYIESENETKNDIETETEEGKTEETETEEGKTEETETEEGKTEETETEEGKPEETETEEGKTEEKETEEKKENKKNVKEKLVEKRKKNLKKIGIDTKDLSDEIIDSITKSFYLYHDMQNIENKIQTYIKLKEKFDVNLHYNYDFYNALKLYFYLQKKELTKNDYVGIILEEMNKDMDKKYREYSVKKITSPINE